MTKAQALLEKKLAKAKSELRSLKLTKAFDDKINQEKIDKLQEKLSPENLLQTFGLTAFGLSVEYINELKTVVDRLYQVESELRELRQKINELENK